ncbi:MAG: ATP-binding protein [Bacteroidales bacterium]|nr:ATP-binding protein [Bacteroidales bacterium]
MNTELIATMLKELNLPGMAERFTALMSLPMQRRPALDVCVSRMIEAEQCHRRDALTERLLKAAKLRFTAHIEDIECSVTRNLTEAMLSEVADCGFIRRGEQLLITGATGCGKSFLACAIGRQACTLGFRTSYMNLNRFMDTIAQSRLDGTFQKMLNKLDKTDLIILDDFGLQPLTPDTRIALLQILEERYERKAAIIASQLPLKNWYDYIGDDTLADAIMDRLVNSSIHIDLKGESMRGRRKR